MKKKVIIAIFAVFLLFVGKILNAQVVGIKASIRNYGNVTAKNIEVLAYTFVFEDSRIIEKQIGKTQIIKELDIGAKKDVTILWENIPESLLTGEYKFYLGVRVKTPEQDIDLSNNNKVAEVRYQDGELKITHKKFVHQYVALKAAEIWGDKIFGRIKPLEGRDYLWGGASGIDEKKNNAGWGTIASERV